MNIPKTKLLIFEDGLDLRYLGPSFRSNDFDAIHLKTEKDLFAKLDEAIYDILVISMIDRDISDSSINDLLKGTKNSSTPILVILDNNNLPNPDDIINNGINIITFPFNPLEFVFRIKQILRGLESDASVDTSLKDYKGLMDSLPVGLVQTDSHGNFLKFNSRFQSIIDMDEGSVLRENFFQLCHPDDYFLERKQLDRLLKKEISRINYEIRLINNEGVTIVCKVTAGAIWNEDNHFNSFAFVVENIP